MWINLIFCSILNVLVLFDHESKFVEMDNKYFKWFNNLDSK